MSSHDVSPGTWAVVGGRGDQGAGRPLNTPLTLASNFVHGADRVYSREQATETWEAFEELIGGWEHGAAVAFASGMAAVDAVFELLEPGAVVVAPDDCYQRVAHLAADGERRGRWSLSRLAVDDTEAWVRAAPTADLLWLESPSNPMLTVADVPAICAAERKRGGLAVVDNTLATPLLQQPLTVGADVVVHSATKFIGGHADLLLGVAVTADEQILAGLRERRALAGAIPGALETYLGLRGARTLPLRLRHGSSVAAQLAERLAEHPEVEVVRYPGLPGHPTHAVANATMSGYGAMIAFDPRGGGDRADAVCRALSVIRHATSLGGVESTIERRAVHSGQEHLPAALLRLSVGCEDLEDLWLDLDRALQATAG